jgi:hypothetical protein
MNRFSIFFWKYVMQEWVKVYRLGFTISNGNKSNYSAKVQIAFL